MARPWWWGLLNRVFHTCLSSPMCVLCFLCLRSPSCVQVLGRQHMDTVVTMNNLASLLFQQGKLHEAAPLFRQ